MKKTLNSLALLGCVSSCLINVAMANGTQEDRVIFLPSEQIGNVACGADARYYDFVVKNLDDDTVRITDIDIDRRPGDDFPHTDIVKLDDSDDDDYFSKKNCYEGKELKPGKSCVIKVEVDPQAITCPEHPIIEDSEVDRVLVVTLNNAQRKIRRPIDFDVTILGSAQEYAMMADYIYIGNDHEDKDHGQVQVSQNVGFADRIFDKDDIIFHDDSRLIYGYDRNAAAFSDADTAYHALRNAAYDATHDCQSNRIVLNGGPRIINPGFYCVKGNRYHNFFTVNSLMVYKGAPDSLFVFVMPEGHHHDYDSVVTLDIDRGASFLLKDGAQANNIYWVGADKIEIDTGVNFVGNILTKGHVHAHPDETPPVLSPAALKGRILGLSDDRDEDNPEHFESEIILDGNSILKP